MVKISAVIITYNEEINIARCIDSLKNVADEIVVLDSFSTDRTPEICKEKGVRFFQHEFDGHIQQKNRVITFASNSHCLSLDADETLSPELEKSILQVKENFSADGYYFNRLNWYCGRWIKHCGWYPDRKLRLFERSKGEWTGVNPHDCYEIKKGGKTDYIKGDLLHYSYLSISQHINQVEKFTSIAANADVERGKTTSLFKIIFYPGWKFIRNYIFKLGILDGYQGYLVCRISAQAAFYKNIKIKEILKEKKSLI